MWCKFIVALWPISSLSNTNSNKNKIHFSSLINIGLENVVPEPWLFLNQSQDVMVALLCWLILQNFVFKVYRNATLLLWSLFFRCFADCWSWEFGSRIKVPCSSCYWITGMLSLICVIRNACGEISIMHYLKVLNHDVAILWMVYVTYMFSFFSHFKKVKLNVKGHQVGPKD